MVEPFKKQLRTKTQCQFLSIRNSSWYYDPKGEALLKLKLMRLIDKLYLLTPDYGSRQMTSWIRRQGPVVGLHRVRRLMTLMGFHAFYQEPCSSQPHLHHSIYPYLLPNLAVTQPNQV
jgi:putative transposase